MILYWPLYVGCDGFFAAGLEVVSLAGFVGVSLVFVADIVNVYEDKIRYWVEYSNIIILVR